MKCRVYVYGINELFSQTYADLNNDGEETPDNFKYDWEDELDITTEVEKYEEHSHSVYYLEGTKSNVPFREPIDDMHLINIFGKSSIDLRIGCSETILETIEIEKLEGVLIIRIFIKDFEPFTNPVPGIYIATSNFPKTLIDDKN